MEKVGTPSENGIREYILSLESDEIGDVVYSGDHIPDDILNAAYTICRRRFKKKAVLVVVVLDEEEEGEAGIAFTASGIYKWTEDCEFEFEVKYEEVKEMDFDDENVYLVLSSGATEGIYCGIYNKFSRHMYNFISDILDYLDEVEE